SAVCKLQSEPRWVTLGKQHGGGAKEGKEGGGTEEGKESSLVQNSTSTSRGRRSQGSRGDESEMKRRQNIGEAVWRRRRFSRVQRTGWYLVCSSLAQWKDSAGG